MLFFWAHGMPDSLTAKLENLKTLAPSYYKDTATIATLNNLAKKHLQINKPEIALHYANEAYAMAQKQHWENGKLLSLSNICTIQNISNHHYVAIQNGLRGLSIAEKQNNRYYKIFFYRSLGNNYDMLDNYKKALPFYNACIKLSANFPAAAHIRANCFVELGDAYRLYYKNPKKAKDYILKGIDIGKKYDPSRLGYAYDYLGQAYTDLGEYTQAENSFRLARLELEKHKKIYLIPELIFHQALLYFRQKKFNEAIKIAKEGVTYSKKMGTIYGESEATKILYLAYKHNKMPIEALNYFEKYTVLRDSLTQVNINYRFEQVQGEYEAQKKIFK